MKKNISHLTTINSFGEVEVIDIEEFVPPTRKELQFQIRPGLEHLDIPLVGKGVRVRYGLNSLTLERIINIPKKLKMPVSSDRSYYLSNGKIFNTVVFTSKVNLVFFSSGELDYIKSNQEIYRVYNELTKKAMILVRKYKLNDLMKQIQHLEK